MEKNRETSDQIRENSGNGENSGAVHMIRETGEFAKHVQGLQPDGS